MLEHRRLSEALDRRLLEAEQSPVHVDAKNLLSRNKIACDRIVSVSIDSILYVVGSKGTERPMTAWLEAKAAGPPRVRVEEGFAHEPGYLKEA
jgi:RES domain-containing protein